MHPRNHARTAPEKPAVILYPSGATLTYGELEARSNRTAHLFRALGLKPGDVIALCLENSGAFFEIAWAAQRSGLYFVCMSTKLTVEEADYVLTDSGAKLFVTSAIQPVAAGLAQAGGPARLFMVGATLPGYEDFEAARGVFSDTPIDHELAGFDMLYSSGTTGRPKGIRPKPITGEAIDAPEGTTMVAQKLYEASADTIYLCPAPLYHAAPLRWCMAMMRLGATSVIMERFGAEEALEAIQRYRVTMAQFVPTHFVRLLKLPQAVRERYDSSSLRVVVHAAAPCPVPVKEQMMAWWGPIIHEYYSGSEGGGGTFIGPQDWLSHKGSVGKGLTTQVKICDDDGAELSPRSEGRIFFAGGPTFEYHNDPEKTAASRHAQGWTTLGDVGWVDEEGFLYLTDRKDFMIISGGVNIYPQEIENLLITHPQVADVAVIGAPDGEMGEKVVAVVQPQVWAEAGPALRETLLAFARENLSHVKAPRQIDFLEALPRHDTGKLYKRLLRDRYRAEAARV